MEAYLWTSPPPKEGFFPVNARSKAITPTEINKTLYLVSSLIYFLVSIFKLRLSDSSTVLTLLSTTPSLIASTPPYLAQVCGSALQPGVLAPCYNSLSIYFRYYYHPRLYQYYIKKSCESMIIQGTAIKPVLFLIPEFIFAAHGLKLIEKEQSCKKDSYDQNYFKAQVPIRTKLWLHTCARCRARCGGKLFLGRVKEQKFIKNYRPNILELMTVPYARSRELI